MPNDEKIEVLYDFSSENNSRESISILEFLGNLGVRFTMAPKPQGTPVQLDLGYRAYPYSEIQGSDYVTAEIRRIDKISKSKSGHSAGWAACK